MARTQSDKTDEAVMTGLCVNVDKVELTKINIQKERVKHKERKKK